jgi:sulfur carrier protein
MRVNVNGESVEIEGSLTVAGLIERYGLAGAACAVEVNRELVRRSDHEHHELHEGDTVEVVTLVGGG